ncbi:hypothetical protein SH2C18_33620 [Clostridium sediminicola]|uniref:hypothetical protein n=1 Tax=Clostridium sediminicola TaxID=3114879 RepID=UPI0031F1E324
MDITIMAVSINPRNEYAPKVQEILTKKGCIIKTRLGLHNLEEDNCSRKGLILLELCSKNSEVMELKEELTKIEGVSVKTMII